MYIYIPYIHIYIYICIYIYIYIRPNNDVLDKKSFQKTNLFKKIIFFTEDLAKAYIYISSIQMTHSSKD